MRSNKKDIEGRSRGKLSPQSSISYLRKSFRKLPRSYALITVVFLCAGMMGAYLVYVTHAASYAVGSEAENGAVSGNAKIAANSGASGSSAVRFGSGVSGINGLHINGNRFVDDSGSPVRLRGVFYVSFEWSCVNGGGNSAQPLTQSAINAMLAWKINFVRIGVTEDCWLGINGAPIGTTAASYQQALVNFVNLLHASGIYTEIGLMYSSTGGNNRSVEQTDMPDEDHAPAFWSSFASTFKNTPDTLLEVYGEPHPNYSGEDPWACWLNGGSSCPAEPYAAAGMQQLVTTIRNTGNNLPIAVPGNDWGNDLSKWLSHKPTDPLNQLAASWDEYFDNGCYASNGSGEANNATCWNGAPATITTSVPLVASELGEFAHSDTCAWNNMPVWLQWAEAHNVSYAVWKWGAPATPGTCVNMALLRDGSGTPSPVYGDGYKNWLSQF